MSSCKVPVIILRFYLNLRFLDRFSKNTQIPNFMKILQVGAEFSMQADRHDEAYSLVRNFANVPKK